MSNAIVNNVLTSNLPSDLDPSITSLVLNGQLKNLPDTLSPALHDQIYQIYAKAVHYVFIAYVPYIAISLVISFLIKVNAYYLLEVYRSNLYNYRINTL